MSVFRSHIPGSCLLKVQRDLRSAEILQVDKLHSTAMVWVLGTGPNGVLLSLLESHDLEKHPRYLFEQVFLFLTSTPCAPVAGHLALLT